MSWLRVVTGALLAVFALPSCITSNLWRSRYQRGPEQAFSKMLVATAADGRSDGDAFAVDVRPFGKAIAALCNPPREQPVRWLLLRPLEHADSVHTLLGAGKGMTMQVVRDVSSDRPPLPHCRLVDRYFVDDCDVELLDAPTTSTDASEVLLEFLDGPNGTLECVLATPVTVALDAVLLPLELLVMAGG